MEVAIEICWNPLDSATQVFKKHMTSLSLPPPSLSLSHSLSLSFLLYFFFSQFSILLSPSDQDFNFL
jgi:hypothetical protein